MTVHVLVVDDDPACGDFVRAALCGTADARYTVECVRTYADGLRRLSDGDIDVGLIGCRLEAASRIDLVRRAVGDGCRAPLMVLTAQGREAVDRAAHDAGAAGYFDRSDLTRAGFERTIGYAVAHDISVR